ncbi:peptidoglycan DD-metalloendopeptidase family protein [Brachybacterium sp. UMB0905]|uniref:peptidoglycan DD-metalloendopeptidase family protein n=1 Tax=Brachybacterium sp. UMB0905 TaxID=2069310 RepID=UPI000C806A6E|nr:peptidoglycan DD-metalloendopeptidase family protein [Brachybacterium sp. UMB0905]PMC76412.1 hypothetical protein CJ197_04450 [Brachybacterium sp. UMB0905]
MVVGGNPVIATAAIGLIPTIQGVRGNIGSQLAGSAVMAETDRAGRSIGSKLGQSITSTLKNGLKIGGVITGAIAGLTLKGGINRALGIEDAQAMMRGLGHDTESVEKIMGNALASVEGTAFGLDAAATSAAGAVAAGIKPGEQLEQTMKTVANVAAGAKAPMEEIGGIFNTVAAVGTAYTGDINMIAQRGIPIWQALGDQLGKSQDEVKKMASKGEIDFATFEQAARQAAGGVATAMGDTTRGSIANMLTSFSKLGADIATRFMPMVKAGAQGIQATVQAVTKKLGPVLDQLFGAFTPAATVGIEGFFDGLVSKIDTFDPQVVLDFFERVKGFVSGIDFTSVSGFFGSLSGGAGGALSSIGGSLSQIGAASPTLLASGLELLGSAMGFLAEHSDTVVKLLPILIAGFAAYKVATQGVTAAVTAQRAADLATLPVQIARNVTSLAAAVARERATMAEIRLTAATSANTATTTRATLAERARTIATKAGAIASKTAAVATRMLGAAIRFATGPIGLIITGVTLLAAGLVYFFTKTETGQKLWTRIWGATKNAAAAVVDWFMNTALPYLQAAWDGIAAGALWLYSSAILPAWNGIKTAIAVVGDWVTGTLVPGLQAAWSAIGAAAMWLWQNVMQPAWQGIKTVIAVVVTAVLLYIDMLKFYFQNVIAPVALWLWKNVLAPAWNGIKTVIGAVTGWIVNTAWPLIKRAWDAIASAAMWLWNNALKPAWAGIKAAISVVVNWLIAAAWPIIQRVIGWIGKYFAALKVALGLYWSAIKWSINAVVSWFQNTAWPIVSNVIGNLKYGFNTMRDSIKNAWAFIKDKAINPVATWFRDTIKPMFDRVTGGVKNAFTSLRDSVKKSWEKIRDTAKAPVKFVVQDIIRDGIVKKYNTVAGTFGVGTIDEKKFSVGWAAGGWTGPGSKYQPAGVVHADEFVIRKESQNDLRRNAPGFLDDLNRRGARALEGILGGYASGGWVKPFRGHFASNSGFGMRWGRLHGGMDFPTPVGTPMLAVSDGTIVSRTTTGPAGNKIAMQTNMPGIVAGYHHLSRFGAQLGQRVTKGQIIGWPGNTGRSTGPHLHFSIARDGSYVNPAPYLQGAGVAGTGANDDGGGLWNPFEGLWDSLKSKVREGVGSTPFGDMLFEVPQKLIGGAVDWASRKLTELGDWASDKLDATAGYTRWAPVATQALQMEGQLGPKRLASLMRRMNQESSFNPRAINNWDVNARNGVPSKGLMQVIDPTFRAYARPGYDKDIWDPLSNILASIRYAMARYGNLEKAYDRPGGYAEGGLVRPTLYDQGGEVPPGLSVIANKTRRPEKILPPRESEALTAIASNGGGGQHFHYSPQQIDLDGEIEHRMRREFESMMHEARRVVFA